MNRIALLSILTLSVAVAEDITLTDGTVLRQAKVLKQEAAALKIEHRDGISRVRPDLLPQGVAQRYIWDTAALESAKRESAAAKVAGDAQEVSRRRAAADEKAIEDRVDALIAERNAERKATSVQAGPLKVWLQTSFPALVERSGPKSGHLYGICIENTGDKTFRGIARGSVYLGSVGDVPLASKLVIEPGRTAKFVVDSQIGCSDETFIAMEIEASNQKIVRLKLPAPKSVSSVGAP